MRILHVIADLHVASGGVASVVNGLSQAQSAAGMTCKIACLSIAGGGPTYLPQNVEITSFPIQRLAGGAVSKELRAWLKDYVGGFDLVHIHGIWQSPNHDAAVAARAAGVPYLIAPHGMLDRWSLQKSPWVKRAYWWLRLRKDCRCAAAMHLLNQAEQQRAPWIASLPAVIVGNGIAASELAAIPSRGAYRQSLQNVGVQQDTPLCLFLSRLHPKKGLHHLLPAWRQGVLAAVPDAHLVIAGTGDAEYEKSLQEIIAKENIANRVHFVGQLAGAAKWQALVDSDLFVLPSSQEGFSMAITEAMAAKCPVVITEDCNFREVAEVGAGLTAPTEDISGFCKAVVELLGNPARRRKMGEAGHTLVRERYTWESIAKEFDRIYADIIDKHKRKNGR